MTIEPTVAVRTKSELADEIRDSLNRVPPTEPLRSLMSNFAHAFRYLTDASGVPRLLEITCGRLRDAATVHVDGLTNGAE